MIPNIFITSSERWRLLKLRNDYRKLGRKRDYTNTLQRFHDEYVATWSATEFVCCAKVMLQGQGSFGLKVL
jgi:hypothetical protein